MRSAPTPTGEPSPRRRGDRRWRGLALVALGWIASAAHAGAPLPAADPAAAGLSPQGLARLHRFMEEATGPAGYAGGVTLLARDGRIVDWRGYGHRDLERTAPMPRDAIFRIYSMSKTIASAAVLSLVEEGRIGLDDPVSRHLPELGEPQVLAGGGAGAARPARNAITIRMLLTHTAGFAAGLPGDEAATALLERADPHAAADLAGFVARLAQAPLAAEPGTRFGYDGAATEVLARVVEVVSGQPFDRFLQARILAPLKMADTGFQVPADKRHRLADISVMGEGGRLVRHDGPSSLDPGARLNAYPSAAGGLYSTAGDYARFCQMLLDGGQLDGVRILARDTVDAMMRNQLTMLDPPVTQFSDAEGFGFGGYVVIDPDRRPRPGAAGQFGWAGAASTSYVVDPGERLVAILLLQHLPGAADDLPRLGDRFYRHVYASLDR